MAVPDVPGCLTLLLPDHWAASDRALEAIEYPNPAWTFQRGHFGELALMPLPGHRNSAVSTEVTMQFLAWHKQHDDGDDGGVLHGFNIGYAPTDDEGRAPGLAAATSWIAPDQVAALREAQGEPLSEYDPEKPFPACAPAFALEIRSPYQSLRQCTDKMRLWMHFGTRLGWLFDPDNLEVRIYRPGRPAQRRMKPAELRGEEVLQGLVFDCRPIWEELAERGEPSRSNQPLLDWRAHGDIRGAVDPSYRPGGSDPALQTIREGPLPLLDLWLPDEWPLDDAALAQLNERNPEWAFEMGLDGGLQITDPTEAEASPRASSSSTLMNPEAPRAPQIMSAATSWVSDERLKNAKRADSAGTIEVVPNFVAEIRSGSQSLTDLQHKMLRWIYHGVQLGWLLDPDTRTVWIYRENQPPEKVESPRRLSGEDVMVGFTLELDAIWDWAGDLEEGGE